MSTLKSTPAGGGVWCLSYHSRVWWW